MSDKKELTKKTKEEVQVPEGVERIHDRKVWAPLTDIYEKNDALVLVCDMPGVDEKSVDITLEKHVLTITGSAPQHKPEGYSMAYTEYEAGDYERAFTISEEVDCDRIEAGVRNGVLTITLPKLEPSRKKIAVKSA